MHILASTSAKFSTNSHEINNSAARNSQKNQ